jgi:hypothetical protein
MNHVQESRSNAKYWRALIFAIIFTLFLFYIDEGYYDFRWMQRAGNWIPFVVYVAIIYGLYLFVSWARIGIQGTAKKQD